MDRSPKNLPAYRSVAGIEDARDLRAAITQSLDATPTDERALRDAVWTFVGAERDAGMAPGRVILAVTGLVESAAAVPPDARQPLLRNAILWCVEAYFGQLGGDGLVRAGPWSDARPAEAAG